MLWEGVSPSIPCLSVEVLRQFGSEVIAPGDDLYKEKDFSLR